MDAVLLARLQFALTIGFHYIFPQLTIGLSWILVWMKARELRTGDAHDTAAFRFWFGTFTLLFVFGVATGITMEFQFGTNWAAYSRYVGDIFGAPLAAEILFSFFLESTFFALLVYGGPRLSRRMQMVSMSLVAFGATLSGFWITAANSWMQTPAGYRIEGGRAVLDDFFAALFNPSTLPRFVHVIDGALIAGAFFMLGISAWYLIRGRHVRFAAVSLKTALVAAALASLLQLPLGHYHAVQVAGTQPEKLAAFEGLFHTTRHAPMLLFGIPDGDGAETRYALRIPGLLSFLVDFSFDTEVQGLTDFPRDEWPPLALTFYPFHIMVGLGMWFIALSLGGLWLWRTGRLVRSRLFLWAALVSTPLPVLANELGWMAAEVGRQPWIVYRLMRTADAISGAVPAAHIALSMLIWGALYILLAVVLAFLLARMVVAGPKPVNASAAPKE